MIKMEKPPLGMNWVTIKVTPSQQQVLNRVEYRCDGKPGWWWARGTTCFRIEKSVDALTKLIWAIDLERHSVRQNRSNSWGRWHSITPYDSLKWKLNQARSRAHDYNSPWPQLGPFPPDGLIFTRDEADYRRMATIKATSPFGVLFGG